MTGPGRGRRRRGRRGQRAGSDTAPQESQSAAPAEETGQPADRPAPEGPAPQHRQGRRDAGGRGSGDAGRRQGRGRRRGSRRPVLGPMPTEVLKRSAPRASADDSLATRTLDAFSTDSGMVFGCPMLSRTRLGLPFAGGHHVPRCSMGWALHDESEAMLCMRTPDPLDCWKEHPEHEAALRASEETENAAD